MTEMAMEWGFRAHEKGMNLEMARIEFRKLIEPQEPVWGTDAFTDEERSTMLELKTDEIRDCIRDYARTELDGESLMDLMAYIDPDIEVTVQLLQAIRDGHACMADYESGEFGHHATSATHMKRFKLVDEAGEKLTEFGEQYLGEYL